MNDESKTNNLSLALPTALLVFAAVSKQRHLRLSRRAIADPLQLSQSTIRHHLQHFEELDLPPALKALLQAPGGAEWLNRLLHAAFVHLVMVGGPSTASFSRFLVGAELHQLFSSSVSALDRWRACLERASVHFADQLCEQHGPQLDEQAFAIAMDENYHAGAVYVAMEPDSGYILIEEAREAVSADHWESVLEKALRFLNVKVRFHVHDQGSALVSMTKRCLGVHHSPDLMHIQRNAAGQSFKIFGRRRRTLLDRIEKVQKQFDAEADGRRRRPIATELGQLRDELTKLEADTVKLREAVRGIGLDYQLYDLTSGLAQSPETLKAKLEKRYEALAEIFDRWGLGEKCFKGLKTFRKESIPALVSTLEAAQLLVESSLSALAFNEQSLCRRTLIPAAYLRLAAKRSRDTALRKELLARAKSLEDQGAIALANLPEESRSRLRDKSRSCAALFQRSSSCVEGRNSQDQLRQHGAKRVSALRRSAGTALYNHMVQDRAGKTAAERLFKQRLPSLFEHLLSYGNQIPMAASERRDDPNILAVAS